MGRIAHFDGRRGGHGTGERRPGRARGRAFAGTRVKSRAGFRPSRFAGFLALALVMVLGARHYLEPDLVPPGLDGVDDLFAATVTDRARRPFPICGATGRADCILDGDTFYFSGEKVRIADIDTPEIFSPRCAHEKALGERATRRLHALLNAGPIELRRAGRDRDRYGRLLRTVHRDGRSLGAVLVAEGLARRWDGARRSWCG